MPERELGPESEPDGVEPLRQAWRGVKPPQPFESFEAPDAQTRAVLAWMGAAWRAAVPPPAALPWRLRWRRPRRIALRIAAAAAVVAALAIARRWAAPPRPEEPVARRGAEPAGQASEGIRVAHVSEDRTEIRSGPVRLILFSPVPSVSLTDGHPVEEPR